MLVGNVIRNAISLFKQCKIRSCNEYTNMSLICTYFLHMCVYISFLLYLDHLSKFNIAFSDTVVIYPSHSFILLVCSHENFSCMFLNCKQNYMVVWIIYWTDTFTKLLADGLRFATLILYACCEVDKSLHWTKELMVRFTLQAWKGKCGYFIFKY